MAKTTSPSSLRLPPVTKNGAAAAGHHEIHEQAHRLDPPTTLTFDQLPTLQFLKSERRVHAFPEHQFACLR